MVELKAGNTCICPLWTYNMFYEQKRQQQSVYALFLYLYPREHRQAYSPLMQQTFKDSYRDTRETEGRIGMKFWLEVAARLGCLRRCFPSSDTFLFE